MPHIHINGAPYESRLEQTVLQVALEHGVPIPNLCHVDALEPVGACRVCLIEASGPGLRPGLYTACTLKAVDGLHIQTDTETVRKTRNGVLEMLLSRVPDAEGIVALAASLGVKRSRLRPQPDPERCILCGRCVRVCEQKLKKEAIAFSGRSTHRRVEPAFSRASLDCMGCGTCANLCPTGTLKVEREGLRQRLYRGRRLVSDLELIPCVDCGAPVATKAFLEWASRSEDKSETALLEVRCPECLRRFRARGIAGGTAGRGALPTPEGSSSERPVREALS